VVSFEALGRRAIGGLPLRAWSLVAMLACLPSLGAHAQSATPAPAASAASAPAATQLQPVEIKAPRPSDLQERRESTAAKIIIGREEIERYGDSTLGDVLKRLPGVTLQGRPGRGGEIRMRGLGSGYTQILLDGQRMAPGFSLDSLTPEQIERIEILRAPTAETGARAIAGTINIVTREGFAKRMNDVRLTAAVENGRLQPSVSWTRNDVLGPFIYNYSLTAFASDRHSDSTTTTIDRRLSDDALTLNQRDDATAREKRHGVHASGRLQWRGEQGANTVTLMPLLIYGAGPTLRTSALTQTVGTEPAPYDSAVARNSVDYRLARLNGQWNQRLDSGARLEWKLGLGHGRTVSATLREEAIAGVRSRTLDDRATITDNSLLVAGKFVRLFEGEHSVVAGGEGEANRRREQRETLQNGVPLLTDFGDNVSAASTRFAAYAQDEWSLTPQWAVHAGLRWEGIATRSSGGDSGNRSGNNIGNGGGDAGEPEGRNRSSVWTPLLHAVWKPEPASRDQVRLSLTRSYRSPALQSLIGRPSINARYPVPGANTPTQPDRAGNPALRPELATGIDIAFERYNAGSGFFSANFFYRSISDYLRSQTALEAVSWSPGQPRWVSRMQNIGAAITQGIELEAKFRLSDLIADAPKLDLRANASVFRSHVKGVPGPDNRLDQQPDHTVNLGADYRVPGWPLTLGGNVNWTPGYDTRISDTQSAFQGRKAVLDAYALWVFSPSAQLRVSASNLGPRDYVSAGSLDDPGANSRETATTTAPTSLNLQVRLELRL
jgi:outer membrane receptor for ferrienterochelin and colicins